MSNILVCDICAKHYKHQFINVRGVRCHDEELRDINFPRILSLECINTNATILDVAKGQMLSEIDVCMECYIKILIVIRDAEPEKEKS